MAEKSGVIVIEAKPTQPETGVCSRDILDATIYDSFNAAENDWVCVMRGGGSIYLSALYQRAAQEPRAKKAVRFAVFYRGRSPVGVARFHVTRLGLGSSPKALAQLRALMPSGLADAAAHPAAPMVFCGDPTISGAHGFYFRPDIADDVQGAALAEALGKVEDLEGARTSLIKEFGSDDAPHALAEHGYTAFETPPNMVLELRPEWRTFDEYLNALSTRYRNRAKATIRKGARLSHVDLGPQDILDHAERLDALLSSVHAHASFTLGQMDVRKLATIRQALGERFVVIGYLLGGELVGYFAATITQGRMDAYCVGFNYALNREHAIYPNMLYDHVRLAIERRVKRILLGRTAEEMKSALGAIPRETKCLVRHRNPIINRIARPIVRRVANCNHPVIHNPFRSAETPYTAPTSTAMHQIARTFIESVKHRGLLGALSLVGSELAFDYRHGTRTVGVSLNEGRIHQGANPRLFRTIISALCREACGATFLDVGSGKGRAMILAAEAGFRRVIGIEISPSLYDACAANMVEFRRRNSNGASLDIVCADAATFDFRSAAQCDPMVVFMFNPFGASVLRRVAQRLRAAARSRRMWIVYMNPVHRVVFESEGFVIDQEVTSPRGHVEGIIYGVVS